MIHVTSAACGQTLAKLLSKYCAQHLWINAAEQILLNDFNHCLKSFETHYSLYALPQSNEHDSLNADLLLIENKKKQFWICVHEDSLFHYHQWRALNLHTGEIEIWGAEKLIAERQQHAVLFERFNTQNEITQKRIDDFLLQPIKWLTKPILLLNVLGSGIVSSIFILLFYTLNSVVPFYAAQSFHSLFVFLSCAVLCLVLNDYAQEYLQLRLKTALSLRKSAILQQFFWQTKPCILQQYGASQWAGSLSALAEMTELKWNIKQQIVSSLILIPILIMTYLRLPLMQFALIMCLVIFLLWVYSRSQNIKPCYQAKENLDAIFSDFFILSYYQQFQHRLQHWFKDKLPLEEAELNTLSMERKNLVWQINTRNIAIVSVLVIASFSISNGNTQTLTSNQLFLLIFISTNLLNLYQRVANIKQLTSSYFQLKKKNQQTLCIEFMLQKAEKTAIKNKSLHIQSLLIAKQRLSLTINQGENLAIKCKDEQEKTKFIKALLGLANINTTNESGVFFDHCPVDSLSISQRKALFSYVHSDSQLSLSSLKDNLFLFAQKDDSEQAKTRKLWTILEWLEIDEMVRRLPLGFNTPLTSVAQSFSTGEMQRLILAQTLMKPASVLLVDNILFGLPKELEIRIFNRLVQQYDIVIYFSMHNELNTIATHWLEL